MNIEPKYKDKRYYNMKKPAIRQPLFIVGLIWVLSKIALFGKKYKVEKINMEDLKPPYLLLSNHMSFMDFELCAMGTWPHRVNNVVNVDGYQMRPWLMELIGAVCTNKFVNDISLVKSISRCLKKGDILCMYPEARYSPCGTTSYLPESLTKLIRLNKVPVVVAVHHGNYLSAPFWNFRKKRKVPLHTTLTQILTAQEAATLPEEEIRNRLHSAFDYDEYRYQLENGIEIKESYRAEGLHRILYQCPHCMTESKMDSKGTELFCTECGKRWVMDEYGILSATDGKTEFSRIPDCFDITTEKDSFYCYPTCDNIITKLAFATEEIYQRA